MNNLQEAVTVSRLGRYAFWFVVGTAVFALAYGQAPLYFSNQNQYFLHGAAQAGVGHLDEDWLAQTSDPTPLFSYGVSFTLEYLGPTWFYLLYALLQGIYLFSLVGVYVFLCRETRSRTHVLLFVAVFVLLHSAVIRAISARWLGTDYPWYLQAGVAGQYVLGPMLQPSVFGVFLILSVWVFLKGRPFLAIACACLGATVHSTYILSAAMLTLAYMAVLCREKQVKRAVAVGAWALLLIAPVVIYNFITFRPTSAETFTRAKDLLVHFRIPHHSIPRLWLDEIAVLQIIWIGTGILLSRHGRLFLVMLIPSLLGAGLTVIQVLLDQDLLALLFPWRVSVILVPLATTVILTRLLNLLHSKAEAAAPAKTKVLTGISAALLLALAVGGLVIMAFRLGFQTRDQELALMRHVRENTTAGETYLIPINVPDLENTVRGSSKSDFRPLKALSTDKQFIPLDLQRFRLQTGAPIYVDFKSIPYRDDDVIEWYDRIRRNEEWYRMVRGLPALYAHGVGTAYGLNWPFLTVALYRMGVTATLAEALEEHGITHVVVRADQSLPRPWFELSYQDDQYRVYRRARGVVQK